VTSVILCLRYIRENDLSVEKSEDPVFRHTVEDSLKTLEQCFAKYKPGKTKLFLFLLNNVLKFMCSPFIQKYFVGAVSVCFNGGKDCIVILHLVHAYFQVKITLNRLLGIINIKVMEPFHISYVIDQEEEISHFVREKNCCIVFEQENFVSGVKKCYMEFSAATP
jgi:hypothetical protein